MCGRYALNRALGQLRANINNANIVENGLNFVPSNNIAPTANVPVVINGIIHLKVWGTKRQTGMLINARSETVREKFRDDAIQRRCLIPADGYFEWNQEKKPHFIYEESHQLIFFAGIYLQSGEFVILTREAHPSISSIHHRMPIIMTLNDMHHWESQNWISVLNRDPFNVKFHLVSSLSLKNGYNGMECVKPVKPGSIQKSLIDMIKKEE